MADYLVKKGVAFRDAHKITGELVYFCIENNKVLEELTIEEMQKFSQAFQDDVYEYIDIELCVENRKVIGGPSSIQTKERLEELNKYIYIKENLLEE